jgi:hypothetical protein
MGDPDMDGFFDQLKRSGNGKHQCGDCRKVIVDACACEHHLRICEEQQRAEDAERQRDTLRVAIEAYLVEYRNRQPGFVPIVACLQSALAAAQDGECC